MASVDSDYYKLTYKEYLVYPNDGNRHEIIGGVHFTNPASEYLSPDCLQSASVSALQRDRSQSLGQVFVQPDLLGRRRS
ncbi:MAG: hypothetical protein Aurels2KO_16690 [Aureliella sp.]